MDGLTNYNLELVKRLPESDVLIGLIALFTLSSAVCLFNRILSAQRKSKAAILACFLGLVIIVFSFVYFLRAKETKKTNYDQKDFSEPKTQPKIQQEITGDYNSNITAGGNITINNNGGKK